jgi:hypothetical protein
LAWCLTVFASHCLFVFLTAVICQISQAAFDLSGVHSLLRALLVNRTLGRLSLRSNGLVPQDLRYKRVWETQELTYSLKGVLAENRSLRVLDLRDNRIEKAGRAACAEAVAASPYVVPHATEVAAILTRWLDSSLTRLHSRPQHILTGGKATDDQTFVRPHFPAVNELLSRPPSPIASVYASLDSRERVAAVARAQARNRRHVVALEAAQRRQVEARNLLGANTAPDARECKTSRFFTDSANINSALANDGDSLVAEATFAAESKSDPSTLALAPSVLLKAVTLENNF